MSTRRPVERRKVEVWLGDDVIARQVAKPDLAARYEAAMRRRFVDLRVTNKPFAPVHPENRDD